MTIPLIIPVTRIYSSLRRGMVRIMGKDEVESLETDAASFVKEVYDDTVDDAMKYYRWRQGK